MRLLAASEIETIRHYQICNLEIAIPFIAALGIRAYLCLDEALTHNGANANKYWKQKNIIYSSV